MIISRLKQNQGLGPSHIY